MAIDILMTASRCLTAEVLEKLASASGLEIDSVRKVTSAIVPSILGALAHVGQTPAGISQLASAMTQLPSDDPQQIVDSLSEPRIAEKGSELVSTLIGSERAGTLASAVSKYADVGEEAVRTIANLVTPLILGVLGREQRAAGPDTESLAQTLTRQRHHFAAAMPASLYRQFEEDGFLDDDRTATTTTSSSTTRQRGSKEADSTFRPAWSPRLTSSWQNAKWPYVALPLLALGIIAWGGWQGARDWGSGQKTTEIVQASPSATPAGTGVGLKGIFIERAPNGWVFVGSRVNGYVGRTIHDRNGEVLGPIKDALASPDGKVVAVLFDAGKLLGIGKRDVAVHVSAIQTVQRGDERQLVIDADHRALEAAPTFQSRNP